MNSTSATPVGATIVGVVSVTTPIRATRWPLGCRRPGTAGASARRSSWRPRWRPGTGSRRRRRRARPRRSSRRRRRDALAGGDVVGEGAVGGGRDAAQLLGAAVELVVADRRDVQAHRVEHLDGRLVLEDARLERRGADQVAGADEEGGRDFSPLVAGTRPAAAATVAATLAEPPTRSRRRRSPRLSAVDAVRTGRGDELAVTAGRQRDPAVEVVHREQLDRDVGFGFGAAAAAEGRATRTAVASATAATRERRVLRKGVLQRTCGNRPPTEAAWTAARHVSQAQTVALGSGSAQTLAAGSAGSQVE